MEILGKLFGGPSKVKIMRLFLQNKTKGFSNRDVAERARVTSPVTRKELQLLSGASFIKKKGDNWVFNQNFRYGEELEHLLVASTNIDKESILENFKKAGKVKLVLISGIFLKNKDSRVDILIVGDKMKRTKVEEGIKKMEAEIGTELTYALFETKEFAYRVNMYDKLVRDILDFPFETVFQAKELSTQALKKA